MQFDFEDDWRKARQLENAGKQDEAFAIYERLLQGNPDRLYVRLRLAAIEEERGDYNKSREHVLRASDTVVRQSRWQDLGAVGRLLLRFDEQEAACRMIEEADWLAPDVVKDASVLAQHFWMLGDIANALEMIDGALTRVRPTARLLYSRANALRYAGRSEEATAEYERCLSIEPAFPYAHWSLAYHQGSPEQAGKRIPRILSAKKRVPENDEGQTYLEYALFKEHERAGDVAAAWQWLQRAAARKRRSLPYDHGAASRAFAEMRQWAEEEPFGIDEEVRATTGKVPIFIVGMPRTGTTLLEQIVTNNDMVAAGGELRDFNTSLCISSGQYVPLHPSPLILQIARRLDPANVGDQYSARTSHKFGNKKFLTDKHPVNFFYSGLIAKALPGSRILCLKRGAMDACFSNLKELFADTSYGYSYDLHELADHYVDWIKLQRVWSQRLSDNFMMVDYEDLVDNAFGVSGRIWEFCGLPAEKMDVDITRNQNVVTTASTSQVRHPINRKGVGAWRAYEKYLSPLAERLHSAGIDVD